MSLLRKLERDTLQRHCKKEVEALHAVFVAWFQGTRPQEELQADLEKRLQYAFSHVAPNGMMVLGRPGLLGQLQDKYGCYHDRVFEIDIYNVQLLWTDTNQCLCTYEEWQSWKSGSAGAAGGGSGGQGNDGVDYGYEDPDARQQYDDEEEEDELVQFGRLSTCLLERTADGQGFTWIHVHETWLEAERPPEGPRAALTGNHDGADAGDEETETIMTGPHQASEMLKQREGAAKIAAAVAGTSSAQNPQPQQVARQAPVVQTTPVPAQPDQVPQESESSSSSSGSEEEDEEEEEEDDEESESEAESEDQQPKPQERQIANDALNYDYGIEPKENDDSPFDKTTTSTAAPTNKSNHGTNDKNLDYGYAKEVDNAAKDPAAYGYDDPFGYEEQEEDGFSGRRVIILMSNACISREQLSQQKMAFRILQAEEIPYEEVDGTDFNHRGRREVLFNISGKRGKYPQFFVAEGDDITYWGDWNRFDQANYQGMLKQELGLVEEDEGEEEDNEDDEEESEEEESSEGEEGDDEEEEEPQEQHPDARKSVGAQENIDNQSLLRQQQQRQEPPLDAAVTPASVATSTAAVSENRDIDARAIAAKQISISEKKMEKNGIGAKESQNDRVQTDAEAEKQRSMPVDVDADNESLADDVDVKEKHFLEASQGILEFEPEEDAENNEESNEEEKGEALPTEIELNGGAMSPIPQDVSPKRHISPKLHQYAKPLRWEKALVGVSIAGFDIGTSQGPIGDEAWYLEMGQNLEELSQSRSIPRPRRKLCLPEMVFPTAHVAIEGHGFWLSWDVVDALEEWAKCHQDISIHSRIAFNGVSVLKSKDAALWESKRKHRVGEESTGSVFHYDWTYSTPFTGRADGGEWQELDGSGMRMSLLTDQSVPILFFDDIVLFEDDMHDNGQVQFSIKLRVMPSCAYFLARLWVRVDNVLVRVRETRVLVDFFGLKPQVFRDVSWREVKWEDLASRNLPTDVRPWHLQGRETPEWNELIRQIPEIELPRGIFKHAVLRVDKGDGSQSDEEKEEL